MPVYRPDAKRDQLRATRRAQHASAFHLASDRITRFLVAEIGKPGVRLLEELGDGTKRGPAEVLEQIVEVARRHKPEADAIAPVAVLACRLGYDLAPQDAPVDDVAGMSLVAALLTDSGAAVQALVEELQSATPEHGEHALKGIDELLRVVHAARKLAEQAMAKAAQP